MKIQDFPELVEVYNKSLFFSDLTLIEAKEIYTYDDNEYDNLVHILGEREAYLQKNKIEDICKYSEWLDTKDTGTFHM
ncbi:MAG TPA: hypothetical protein DER56_07045, partial [Thermosipho africanus]|nr:hypothetical protein [Thermosipho africanus]